MTTVKNLNNEMRRKLLVESFIEIAPPDNKKDDTFFLILKESLTRIGIASFRGSTPTLHQTCHVLHKKGKYYLVHFKELFLLDNRLRKKMTYQDEKRKRCIAKLLEDWGLMNIISPFNRSEKFNLKRLNLTIIPYTKKSEWVLQPKYNIGKVRIGGDNTSNAVYWKDGREDEEEYFYD
ncbi:MAG: translational repressor RegA [Patescibacteria group bacterium]|nr:translational repressor RegA [Patescibacteria group bacterium]